MAPPIKSKTFVKKYATSLDHTPNTGVWSGRGIAIPTLGAIGGGDDYKQKIGRGKRPYYIGDKGTPSQGADSTFSSYLARVNTGYDKEYEGDIMFPEQEQEEEDNYSSDEPSNIRSRKLPNTYRVLRPKLKGIREMSFNDDSIVANSKYSLADLDNSNVEDIIDFIKESIYPDYGSYHPPMPTGYEYRNVPTVITSDADKNEFDVLDDYDNVSVAYKSDGGVTAYQDRNKLVKEEALRRIIRSNITSIVDESKKKNY